METLSSLLIIQVAARNCGQTTAWPGGHDSVEVYCKEECTVKTLAWEEFVEVMEKDVLENHSASPEGRDESMCKLC